MENTSGSNLLAKLTELSNDISLGKYDGIKELFELTKKGQYPEEITTLAEAFGMMVVKVEAREFNLQKNIEELQNTRIELEKTRDILARENLGLRKSLGFVFSPQNIIGQSKKMQELIKIVERVADTPVTVLITGETGTGKELIAKSLHFNSSRQKYPFVALNCAALPESLIESELFGIEKGVATGVERRAGRIEQAHNGTLFLDEIGDMPISAQVKLLRVLEEREAMRIGGQKPVSVDIRVISATNKDLKKEISEGKFRSDLYYRLKVIEINIPPLRERKEDIPIFLITFLDRFCKKFGRQSLKFSREAIEYLMQYDWRGNVRELENEVERAVALAVNDTIMPEDLSRDIIEAYQNIEKKDVFDDFPENINDMERKHVFNILDECKGNKSEAAKRLGISREGLRKKLKRMCIADSENSETE